MTHRTDPMYYEFDIREKKTGEVRRVPIFCWWSGEHSIAERRRMCDCQLAGFFNTPPQDFNTQTDFARGTFRSPFIVRQNDYLKNHKCDHKPSRKYTVTRAYLPSGEQVEIAA